MLRSSKSSGCCDMRLVAFVLVGGITLIYVIVELAAAIYFKSLTLLSDGYAHMALF